MEVLDFINKNKDLKYEDIKNILENKYNLQIKLDKTNDYYMISTTKKSNFSDPFVRKCTGIIINKANNKILHYFGEKAYETFDDENNNIIKIEDIDIKNCFIAPYINGYIVKVFNYKNKWRFATTKHTNIKLYKINNTKSSLYEIFEKCILNLFNSMDDFLNILETSFCYSFILNDNKLYIINKIYINKLEEFYNINNFKPLFNFNINNDFFEKYIIIEKDEKNIKRKIHISINDIKKIILN